MSIRLRFFLILVLLTSTIAYWSYSNLTTRLETKLREAVEENLVDQVQFIASLLAIDNDINKIDLILKDLHSKTFSVKIYDLVKTESNIILYYTDADGKVLYHSRYPQEIGKDYSAWRDVKLTLQGEYGARSTRDNPSDPNSSVLYIAAPIKSEGKITNVITLGKRVSDFSFFFHSGTQKLKLWSILIALTLIVSGLILSIWLTHPLNKLQRYTRYLLSNGSEKEVSPPNQHDIKAVSEALKSMKVSLDDRLYIENYIQILTHELKSPLTGIMGAAEILSEKPDLQIQEKFIENIKSESARIKELVDLILTVASLERTEGLESKETINFSRIISEVEKALATPVHQKRLRINYPNTNLEIEGDFFLLRQAFQNVLINAVEYAPQGSEIHWNNFNEAGAVLIEITDEGPGIPEFALNKIFDKFFSLPKPETGKKGTGLGLAFVKEVSRLHGWKVSISNAPPKGARVRFRFKGETPESNLKTKG
jgi:two-component system sensor histidine kinase CreC